MSLNLTTFKTMGIIYEIPETEFTKNGYPKRHILLEIPTVAGDTQKTIIRKFVTFGDDCAGLDFYKAGEFVELLFKLDSFEWKKKELNTDTGKEETKIIHLQSDKIVDIHKRDNPFLTKEKVADTPDDLSPDVVADLATHVKDYSREPAQTNMFKPEPDDLPF